MQLFVIIVLLLGFGIAIRQLFFKPKRQFTRDEFAERKRKLLLKHVLFYEKLDEADREKFELQILQFLDETKLTGINTEIEELDEVLIAASAIIPIFGFDEWDYHNLDEVLVYPDRFNTSFEHHSEEGRNILGMVGSGFMNGKMILSKTALRKGFKNETDKKNTAIHEFVHLLDMADGAVDGVPEILLERQYVLPWLDLIKKKSEEMLEGDSDIRDYGLTNQAEFFSVVSEYFFERPKLFKRKHPELYQLMTRVFDQQFG